MKYQTQSLVLLLLLLNVQGTQLVTNHHHRPQSHRRYKKHHDMVQLNTDTIDTVNPDIIDETIMDGGINFVKGITDETMAYGFTDKDIKLVKEMHTEQKEQDGEFAEEKKRKEDEKKEQEAEIKAKFAADAEESEDSMGFAALAKKRDEIIKKDLKAFDPQEGDHKKEERSKNKLQNHNQKKSTQVKKKDEKQSLADVKSTTKEVKKSSYEKAVHEKFDTKRPDVVPPQAQELVKSKVLKKQKTETKVKEVSEQSIQSYMDVVNELDTDEEKAENRAKLQMAQKKEKDDIAQQKEDVLDTIWSQKLEKNNEDTNNVWELDNQTKLEQKMRLSELTDPSYYDLPTLK